MVKTTAWVISVLAVLCVEFPVAAQSIKIGVINFQSAMLSTKDGQKAAADIQTRVYAPKKAEIEKHQAALAQLQDQLNKGRNTLSEEARQKLMRDIDQRTKALNRESEDAQAELNQEEQRVMNELGGRIIAVIQKYAADQGFSLILDDSSPQTPLVYASNTIDVSRDIIEMYDKNAPSATGVTAPAPGPAAPVKS